MTPEMVCETLMTYNAMSGILFSMGLIVIFIYVLRNNDGDDDWDDWD